MNEQIKELIEQAGLKYYNWSTNESNVADGNFKYPRLEDYEKFAELIVRECIDIVSPYAIRMENFDGGHPIADLKKHFGVRE